MHLLSDDSSVLAQLDRRTALPEMSDSNVATLSLSKSRILFITTKYIMPGRSDKRLEIRSPKTMKRLQNTQHDLQNCVSMNPKSACGSHVAPIGLVLCSTKCDNQYCQNMLKPFSFKLGSFDVIG